MKKLIILFVLLGTFTTGFAQSTNYQFLYYKAGTDAEPVYYFSDLFTTDDWYKNQYKIKSSFEQLLKEEGLNINSYSVQQGLKGANTADSKYKANEFKDIIIQQDKDNFEKKQSQYSKERRDVFKSSKRTLPLYRL